MQLMQTLLVKHKEEELHYGEMEEIVALLCSSIWAERSFTL